MDLTGINQHIGLEVLDVIQLGELTTIIRSDKLVKLFESLASQVIAVHQEKHTVSPGVLDEAIDEIDCCEGLASVGGHLDEGAG